MQNGERNERMTKCITPNYEDGGYDVGKHEFDKNGWCIFCGYHKLESNPKEFQKFLVTLKGGRE